MLLPRNLHMKFYCMTLQSVAGHILVFWKTGKISETLKTGWIVEKNTFYKEYYRALLDAGRLVLDEME